MKKPRSNLRWTLSSAAAALVLVTGAPGAAQASGWGLPPMLLTLEAPRGDSLRFRYDWHNRVLTLDYRNRRGLLTSTQWPLTLRLESRTAEAYVKEFLTGQNREGLVLRDPDDCLVLTSLIDDIDGLGRTSYDPLCMGVAEDETYIEVQTEKYDTFELGDNSNTGNDKLQQKLIDDDCTTAPADSNVACLLMDNGKLSKVGPKTGDDVRDGYGYGTDDDAASMVLMMNVGGARVFDPMSFDRIPGRLRNMAGLINTVSSEFETGIRTTAIVMHSHALAGFAEPIAVFDFDVSDPAYAGFSSLRRVDSGPIEPFNYVSAFPTGDNSNAAFNPFYDEIVSTYYPAKVEIRAVAVNGEAPAFIDDMNGDGRYTAADLMLAGYTLVSNEIKTSVTVINDNLLVESDDPKCPPRTLIYRDLDGNGSAGAPEKCLGTSSSTRLRRRR
ncbi:MAG: hypothetical protein AAFX44_01775 [Pseudomonadota bacterium]